MRTLARHTAVLLSLSLSVAHAQSPLPYRDPALTPHERAADLLARMTLEEKVGQLTQIQVTRLMGRGEWDRGPLNEDWLERVLKEQQVGSILSGGGGAPVPNTPEAWARMTNQLQEYAIKHSRLGIPLLYGVDAVHGHNNVVDATMYPHNLGLAATFDVPLARAIGQATAKATRATGASWNFAPVADVGRDPRWGRYYETFGEDPTLASELVRASVRGLQGEQLGPDSVAATLKHFIGYGAPEGGQDRANALIPQRTLREVHLPPYQAGLEAGAASVMVNSGAVNGVPGHASRELLTGLLRDELGFTGVTISDWEDIARLHTVHKTAPTYREAVRQALSAGVDVSMVPNDAQGFTSATLDLVRSGQLPESRIDEAARRVLELKFRLGLFEQPLVDPARAQAAVTGGRDLALRAARQSITLLRNEGNVLPLRGKSVLVAGERARDPRSQLGGWSIGWQGLPEREDTHAVTVLDGLKQGKPQDVRLAFSPELGGDVRADVIVAVVGEKPGAEGQADNPTLSLGAQDEALLRRAVQTGKPVVAVLLAGRPIVLPPDLHERLAGLVMAYLPGSEGGRAVADVLYGSTNPAGRLPFSWPRHPGQLPLTHDALPGTKYDPLYAFGEGLSYTTFGYGELRAQVKGERVEATVDVTNTGQVAGSHALLAYAGSHSQGSHSQGTLRPRRQLVAFDRLVLQPGETRRVKLDFPLSRLAAVPGDAFSGAPREVQAGEYRLQVGDQHSVFRVADRQ